ncbi:MAG: sodium:panthothenate symporter [Kiritimatiellae bacterium]|nr:sodium:panthothenate symporter [Kiritimatiellia bacterium]
MTWLSWMIVILPVLGVLFAAFYSKRYVKDVADYLACGRVAGRYVISVGDMAAGLSVISLVAASEANYQVGIAYHFWGAINTPIAVLLALSGYCVYRFRQTRCLSIGQFLELRYSRSFRMVAASIRTIAEMITNAIGPAVAVRFFIYFLGIPHHFTVFGLELPTYGIMVALLLILATAIIWPAGRISLLVTDSIQGMMSYPIFVIFVVFVLSHISWFNDVAPVMLDRAAGESFLNPKDIHNLRDFNMFAIFAGIVSNILNRAAWIGNDTSGSARNPHEQKMASILGTWRNGFSYTMMSLIGLFLITYMLSNRYASEARDVRVRLSDKVAAEVVAQPEIRAKIAEKVAAIPVASHVIGQDPPYSQKNNPDTPYLDAVLTTLRAEMPQTDGASAAGTADEAVAKHENPNFVFQKFRSLYNQMMMPTLLGGLFSPVLMGLFTLLMVMLLISTDDSRIFNASSTIIQDIVVPIRRKEMSVFEHLTWLKGCTLGVTILFFVISLFFAQLDFINMFTTIMCALWLGASGPIMLGGLYTRFGTTFGAWCSLAFGSGTAFAGLLLQRNWADHVYPWIENHGYVDAVGNAFVAVSRPFNPWIVWEMNPIKFPINSIEISFIAMMLGIVGYLLGSLLTYREPFNLDRLLHRGKYHPDGEQPVVVEKLTIGSFIYRRMIGITAEYTRGDRIIAWSVFLWSIVYGFGIMFCGVLIWNKFSPWPVQRWGVYYYITTILASILVGCVSTVWFLWGGFRDMVAMFRDLAARVANPLDDGRVVGHVSLADKEHFEEVEEKATEDEPEPKA